MSKHTPGPWNTDHHPGDVWAANGRFIADCHSVIVKEQFEESCANARLIAAAPETAAERDRLKASNAELVEALSALVEQFTAYRDGWLGSGVWRHRIGLQQDMEYALLALSRATETKG